MGEPLWFRRGMGIALATLRIERDRDAAEAATALIITVNWQHHPAMEQAAPEVTEPVGKVTPARFGRHFSRRAAWIHFRHVPGSVHASGQNGERLSESLPPDVYH